MRQHANQQPLHLHACLLCCACCIAADEAGWLPAAASMHLVMGWRRHAQVAAAAAACIRLQHAVPPVAAAHSRRSRLSDQHALSDGLAACAAMPWQQLLQLHACACCSSAANSCSCMLTAGEAGCQQPAGTCRWTAGGMQSSSSCICMHAHAASQPVAAAGRRQCGFAGC